MDKKFRFSTKFRFSNYISLTLHHILHTLFQGPSLLMVKKKQVQLMWFELKAPRLFCMSVHI